MPVMGNMAQKALAVSRFATRRECDKGWAFGKNA
jgi:hypothetical protein